MLVLHCDRTAYGVRETHITSADSWRSRSARMDLFVPGTVMSHY
jgi:hypothetical protein